MLPSKVRPGVYYASRQSKVGKLKIVFREGTYSIAQRARFDLNHVSFPKFYFGRRAVRAIAGCRQKCYTPFLRRKIMMDEGNMNELTANVFSERRP